jgi:hypothetical protein
LPQPIAPLLTVLTLPVADLTIVDVVDDTDQMSYLSLSFRLLCSSIHLTQLLVLE